MGDFEPGYLSNALRDTGATITITSYKVVLVRTETRQVVFLVSTYIPCAEACVGDIVLYVLQL